MFPINAVQYSGHMAYIIYTWNVWSDSEFWAFCNLNSVATATTLDNTGVKHEIPEKV